MNEQSRITIRYATMVFIAVLVGVGFYLAARVAPPPAPAASPPSVRTPAPAPPVDTPQAPHPGPEPQPAPTAPMDAARPAAAEQAPNPDISGTWALYVNTEEDEGEEPGAWERYRLAYRDGQWFSEALHSNKPCTVALDGMTIRLVTEFDGRGTWTFEGTFNAARSQAAGTYDMLHRHADPAIADTHDTYAARLVHITEEQLAAELRERDLKAARLAEANSIFKGLKRFAARNDGKFPASLAQLTPDDLSDLSLVANHPGRRIVYDGSAELTRTEQLKDLAERYKERGRSTESLVDYERGLREAWGGKLPFAVRVLRLEYDDPPFAIDVASSGDQRTSDEGETESPGIAEEESAVSLREAEFNNLKQLGLVLKMFAGENGDYLPGGWLMVYPEYLTDLRVLGSPWAPADTESYDLVFPGQTEEQLEELARSLIESGALSAPDYDPSSPALRPILQSMVPSIIAHDNLPADPDMPPARAVAFLDGRVQAVPLSEWDARIAPFLNR